MVHPCTKLPIAWYHRVAGYPSQGAIVCKIYYVKVPSCGYVAHCVVPWEDIAWSHRGPMFPMSRCHRVPMFPMSRCHYVPLSPKVTHHTGYPPCAKGGYPMIPAS